MGIEYVDNMVDVGIRLETSTNNYPIVTDYYDPKFLFPDGVRTFCTNSCHARVVLERYQGFNLVNGHALSTEQAGNNLVNFALLKTIGLKDPVRSGQQMAVYLGRLANEIGGGMPLMQRVGDFAWGSVPLRSGSTKTSTRSLPVARLRPVIWGLPCRPRSCVISGRH